MRRFFAPIESFGAGHAKLGSDETRHLRNVLRLRVGDEASVFDGMGREFSCIISEIAKQNSTLTVIKEIAPASSESPFEITLAATVLNGEKYDLVIQKAVELGVTTFIPLHTAHCDVKVKDARKRMTRWQRIALEATKQSGRAKIMQIADPIEFIGLLKNNKPENLVLFSEREGKNIFLHIQPAKQITAVVGPKGGWDDSELEFASAKKIKIVTLGGRILRAETAAISITAILQHKFGDLN